MATPRQTWALFCVTGLDCRGIELSVDVASDLMDQLRIGNHTSVVEYLKGLGAKGEAKAAKKDWAPIWQEALNAGSAAGNAHNPRPMHVVGRANPLDDNSPVTESWVVNDGACGFAWVKVKGNTSFGRWAKKHAGFRKDSYAGGLLFWISAFNQSYERKFICARKIAEILQKHGVDAYASGRMD